MNKSLLVILAAVLVGASASLDAQEHTMPPGATHEEHLAQMKKDAELKARGAAAMGFDQETTAHHFRLANDGGAIEVAVKRADDAVGVAAIRAHLAEVASEFSSGNFEKPLATHGEVPPRVSTLRSRKALVRYRYEDIDGGGRVVIHTVDARALEAVHAFLRYQIRAHATGDPVSVGR